MANKKYDYDKMTEEELRDRLKSINQKKAKSSVIWHKEHPERHKEAQKKYRKTLGYAKCQLAYWQRKVEELSKHVETEAKE